MIRLSRFSKSILKLRKYFLRHPNIDYVLLAFIAAAIVIKFKGQIERKLFYSPPGTKPNY